MLRCHKKKLRASDQCFVTVVFDFGVKRITTVYDVVWLSELRLKGLFSEKHRPGIVRKQRIQGREIKNLKSTCVCVNVVVHVRTRSNKTTISKRFEYRLIRPITIHSSPSCCQTNKIVAPQNSLGPASGSVHVVFRLMVLQR